MVRGISLVLAIGLVVLWILGLSQHATGWMTWLDGLGALIGFAIAGGVTSELSRTAAATGPVALAIGLGVLWIIGLATNASLWLTWWTFAFAVAFLLVGIGAGVQPERRSRIDMQHPRTV